MQEQEIAQELEELKGLAERMGAAIVEEVGAERTKSRPLSIKPTIGDSLGVVMVSPKGLRDLAKWVEERKRLTNTKSAGYPVEVSRVMFRDGAAEIATILFRDPEDSDSRLA